MKIQFTKEYTDGFEKTYQPGWVADWSQPDAERAIEEGFAVVAPEGAYPRKQPAPVMQCAVAFDMTLTGPFEKKEEIQLEDLTEPGPKKDGFFKKK